MLAQRAHHLVQEGARGRHADHRDEIADRGVDQAERRRKLLRARLVGEVAHGLQRDHAAHALATLGELLGVAPAAHVRRAEVGRLLVDEQHVADAHLLGLPVLQQPRQLQRGGHAGAVVVGAGRVVRGIVVRAHHQRLRLGAAALRLARRLDVAHRAALDVEDLPADGVAVLLQSALDVLGRPLQRRIVLDVVRARWRSPSRACAIAPRYRAPRPSPAGSGPSCAVPGTASAYQAPNAIAAIGSSTDDGTPAWSRTSVQVLFRSCVQPRFSKDLLPSARRDDRHPGPGQRFSVHGSRERDLHRFGGAVLRPRHYLPRTYR